MATSTDRFGHTSTSRYDVRGQLVESRTQTLDESGQPVTLVSRTAYDRLGRAIASTDPFLENVTPLADVRTTHTLYDALGRVVETRRLAGVVVGLVDDSNNYGAAPGTIWKSSFDAGYSSGAIQSSTSTAYDSAGRVFSSTSATDLVTFYRYDAAGRQTQTIQAIDLNQNGTTDASDTNSDGIPDTGSELLVSTTEYDAAGRVTKSIGPDGQVVTQAYDAAGRATSSTLVGDGATGNMVSKSVYDLAGRRIAAIDPLNRQTDYAYDAAGRLTSVKLPSVTDGDPASGTFNTSVRPLYSYEYDSRGNQTAIVDPRLSRTEFTHDEHGRQLTRQLPLGVDAEDTSFTETKVYDHTPNLTVDTNGDGTADSDPGYGQLLHETDFEGRVTQYLYDHTPSGRGRLTAKRYFESVAAFNNGAGTPQRTISYTYDAFGRQVEVADDAFTDPTTSETLPTVYGYDADGRLTKIDSPQGTLHYSYDDLGRKTAAYTGDAATGTADATTATTYGYDKLGRLIAVTAARQFGADVSNQTTKYVYDKAGRLDYELLPITSGSFVTKDYVYDALGRTAGIAHFVDADSDRLYDSGETLFDKFDYTYFLDGSRASETRVNSVGTTSVSWTYDGLNRLLSETFSGKDGQGAALAYADTYSFDLASNRTRLVHDDTTSGGTGSAGPDATTTYVYDANDRLLTETKDVAGTSTGDRHTVYGYGPTDQTDKTVHDGLDDTGTVVQDVSFTFDATGRMTGVAITAGGTTTTVSYAYNADGFRVEATTGGVTTVFHVDPNNPTGYIQVLEKGADAGATPDGRLDPAEIGQAFVLALDVVTQATPSQLLHLLYDAHGTTKSVLNAATSAVVERYVYSAYGIDLGLSATPLTAFRYAGEFIDSKTGLSNNRARWFERGTGRFNRLDPWTGNIYEPLSLNKYGYGHASPMTGTDPSGLFQLADLGLANFWQAVLQGMNAAMAAAVNIYARSVVAAVGFAYAHPWLTLAGQVVALSFVPEDVSHGLEQSNIPGFAQAGGASRGVRTIRTASGNTIRETLNIRTTRSWISSRTDELWKLIQAKSVKEGGEHIEEALNGARYESLTGYTLDPNQTVKGQDFFNVSTGRHVSAKGPLPSRAFARNPDPLGSLVQAIRRDLEKQPLTQELAIDASGFSLIDRDRLRQEVSHLLESGANIYNKVIIIMSEQ